MKNPASIKTPMSGHTPHAPGMNQNAAIDTAAPTIITRQTRGPRPPATRSVARPASTIPAMPAISKSATTHPALSSVSPFDSLRSIGPQSRIANRTRLMAKLASPSTQMTGLRKTIFPTVSPSPSSLVPRPSSLCGTISSALAPIPFSHFFNHVAHWTQSRRCSVRKNKGSNLSGGERRRCEIARCLASNPKFILLDEPFAGVDPIAVEDIQTIVAKLKEKNIGILITDHNVHETLSITDRAYLLFEGSVLKSGTAEELAADPQVRKVYLGSNFELRK